MGGICPERHLCIDTFPQIRGVLINLEDHRHHRPIPSFC